MGFRRLIPSIFLGTEFYLVGFCLSFDALRIVFCCFGSHLSVRLLIIVAYLSFSY